MIGVYGRLSCNKKSYRNNFSHKQLRLWPQKTVHIARFDFCLHLASYQQFSSRNLSRNIEQVLFSSRIGSTGFRWNPLNFRHPATVTQCCKHATIRSTVRWRILIAAELARCRLRRVWPINAKHGNFNLIKSCCTDKKIFSMIADPLMGIGVKKNIHEATRSGFGMF